MQRFNRVRHWRGIYWDRIAVLIATLVLLVVCLVRLPGASAAPPPAPVGAAAVVPTGAGQAVAAGRRAGLPCPPPVPHVVTRAPGPGRTVALTFDDGPGAATPAVLDVLRRERVRATFFVVGQAAEARPELLRAIADQGHLVANHTWSHRPPGAGRAWSRPTLLREIRRTSALVEAVTGQAPCWFRPPQGVVRGAVPVAAEEGLSTALWSVDTQDWRVGAGGGPVATGAELVRARATAGDEENPVVLLHDGGGARAATVAALPAIVAHYRDLGYTFVGLDGR